MSTINLVANPAQHSSIILSKSWTTPHPHADNSPVLATTPAAATNSQVLFVYEVDLDVVPPNATHLYLRVKVKADIVNGTDTVPSYGLIYGRIPGNNHFIHCETWSRGPRAPNSSRRVTYATLFVPIVDGKIEIQTGSQINGRATLELAVYLEGYLT